MDRLPVAFQRPESVAVVALVTAVFVGQGFAWWWLLVLFLAFDLSMVGYAVSPRLGAWTYNAGHSYVGPALLGLLALGGARWAAFVALAWAFHVGVDRALGYGLKFTDRFQHTHLGDLDGRPAAIEERR